MSDGITVTAPDIYSLRAKLGVYSPWIGIRLTGPTDKPLFRVDFNGETYTSCNPEVIIRHVARALAREMKKAARNQPKRRAAKSTINRPKEKR